MPLDASQTHASADDRAHRIAVTIPVAADMRGSSRSQIYRDLAAGKLRAVKRGKRTLILVDSLRAEIDTLPAATFRAGASANR